MKRNLLFAILMVMLPFWVSAQALPPGCIGSHNPGGPAGDPCNNIYCYCTVQTSSDSWDHYVYSIGNEGGYAVEYCYDQFIAGPGGGTTTHIPWAPATFPIVLSSGMGGTFTNLQIRIVHIPAGGIGRPWSCDVGFIDGVVGPLFNVGPC